MSVKIKGLKLFNANIYDKLTIVEKEGSYTISVQCYKNDNIYTPILETKVQTKKVNQIPTYDFKSENEGKMDEEILINLIEKFLEYAIIDELNSEMLSYKRKYQIASGNRQLKLDLFNEKLKIILQMVRKKYLEDRLRFCAKNKNIKNIIIDLNRYTSYRIDDDSIKLTLRKDIKGSYEIWSYDKQFFQQFISEKLNEIGEVANLEYGHTIFVVQDRKIMLGYMNLTCGNLKIDIEANPVLLELIKQIVEIHNQELKENKIIQLKMEGF